MNKLIIITRKYFYNKITIKFVKIKNIKNIVKPVKTVLYPIVARII